MDEHLKRQSRSRLTSTRTNDCGPSSSRDGAPLGAALENPENPIEGKNVEFMIPEFNSDRDNEVDELNILWKMEAQWKKDESVETYVINKFSLGNKIGLTTKLMIQFIIQGVPGHVERQILRCANYQTIPDIIQALNRLERCDCSSRDRYGGRDYRSRERRRDHRNRSRSKERDRSRSRGGRYKRNKRGRSRDRN